MNLETLKMFCVNAGGNFYYLENPFSMGEFTFASDKIIVVRVGKIDGVKELVENYLGDRRTKILQMFHEHDNICATNYEWIPVEYIPLPVPCYDRCEDCTKHTIAIVDGKLFHIDTCNECMYIKDVEMRQSVDVNGVLLSNKYLAAVKMFMPNASVHIVDERHPAWIRFDGGIAMLMPMINSTTPRW